MSSPKVWFITGASSGLGRAVTELVLAKGDIAVATLRKPEVLSYLSDKYDATKLLILKVDVSKADEIKAAFVQVEKTFGRLDVVLNNAGYGALSEVESTPDDVARGIFDVNFWGSTNVSKEAVRFFRDVNKPGVGGRLIAISSMAGFNPIPVTGYYGASKAALQSVSEALAKELDPSWNIKITIIHLGGFATRITQPESLIVVPAHPAYGNSPAAAVRKAVAGPETRLHVDRGAAKVYEISQDPNVPLHFPLGLDSLALVTGQLESVTADVEKAKKWSADLK